MHKNINLRKLHRNSIMSGLDLGPGSRCAAQTAVHPFRRAGRLMGTRGETRRGKLWWSGWPCAALLYFLLHPKKGLKGNLTETSTAATRSCCIFSQLRPLTIFFSRDATRATQLLSTPLLVPRPSQSSVSFLLIFAVRSHCCWLRLLSVENCVFFRLIYVALSRYCWSVLLLLPPLGRSYVCFLSGGVSESSSSPCFRFCLLGIPCSIFIRNSKQFSSLFSWSIL